ncbi:MAG: BBP7 family outer membrane beta-barrel protein [Gemmataceae bacterium]|nr:BBP7 family outer membrane beta-barrel protein [Gemmataceae bacterium]
MTWKTLLPAGLAWAALAGPAVAGDLPKSVLATPLPPGPGATVPAGGPLAAPVITPAGTTKHGHQLFDVIPTGWGDGGSIRTSHPERHLLGKDHAPDHCPPAYPPACGESRGWVGLEFLFWATRSVSVPPLLTSGPASAAPGVAGALGRPTTDILFGRGGQLDEFRPGFRLEAGLYRDESAREAIFARFFFIGSESEGRSAASFGQAVLALPQALPGGGTFPLYVGYPGLTAGVADASVQTDFFGVDANLQRRLCDSGTCRFDAIGGFRYLYLGDRLDRRFALTSDPNSVVPGVRAFGEESVRTRNNFYGGQVGLGASGRWGALTAQARLLVALGVTDSELDGSLTRTAVGGPFLVPVGAAVGGGSHSDYFAVVPEAGVKFGWQPRDHLRFTVGYDWVYWSRVRRAPEAFALGPVPRGGGTDVWAQGFNAGLELRY